MLSSPEIVLRRPVTGTASLIHESGAGTWIWLADMQNPVSIAIPELPSSLCFRVDPILPPEVRE